MASILAPPRAPRTLFPPRCPPGRRHPLCSGPARTSRQPLLSSFLRRHPREPLWPCRSARSICIVQIRCRRPGPRWRRTPRSPWWPTKCPDLGFARDPEGPKRASTLAPCNLAHFFSALACRKTQEKTQYRKLLRALPLLPPPPPLTNKNPLGRENRTRVPKTRRSFPETWF